jgi:murein DD-endopeptidase MepM/ murein hydrolase activator NlpD
MAARMHRLRVLLLVVSLPLLLWAVLPLPSSGAPLQSRIEAKRQQVESKRQRERVLAGDVAQWSRRINLLQGDIATLQARQVRLQADLDAKRAELARIQERLRQERLRLARLRSRLAEGREALATRLVELYKADRPDYVTVILEADGYADLLERTEFMRRVGEQDRRIIEFVQLNKAEATATAKRLDGLEERQQRITATVAARRDQVAAIKGKLVDRRENYESARSQKATMLASTREQRHDLEGDLKELEAANARVQAQLAGVGGTAPAGPVRAGAGGLVWPVNGPIVSPFGPRWGRLHAGVDIAAPAGTPIRASASGKVVLLGWTGGYGNYTCIAHGGALSTCYAHQSRYATSSGASVSKGQVIGYVGCTGHCFGDHVHFETRINGTPVNPAGYL